MIVLSETDSKHLTGLGAFGMDMETQSKRAGETQLRPRENGIWGRGVLSGNQDLCSSGVAAGVWRGGTFRRQLLHDLSKSFA